MNGDEWRVEPLSLRSLMFKTWHACTCIIDSHEVHPGPTVFATASCKTPAGIMNDETRNERKIGNEVMLSGETSQREDRYA